MENLFQAAAVQEIVDRINKLTPDTAPLWGKMRVEQMLAHSQATLYVALGEKKIKGGLLGFLFGKIAKKQLLKDGPLKKNIPTDPSFVVKDNRNFNEEKTRLIDLVRRFGNSNPEEIAKQPHPFFGKLSVGEWNTLQWKHLDHHLRQFGV